jgi:hypothetical protein
MQSHSIIKGGRLYLVVEASRPMIDELCLAFNTKPNWIDLYRYPWVKELVEQNFEPKCVKEGHWSVDIQLIDDEFETARVLAQQIRSFQQNVLLGRLRFKKNQQ